MKINLWKKFPIKFRIAAFALAALCTCTDISAQRTTGQVGIGFQVGSPTGLSLQFYRETGMYADILFAYDLDDFYFINVHGLWDTHLDREQQFHFYYGPGLFLGFRDNNGTEDEFDNPEFGMSGNFGLNYVFGRAEIFGQLTPRLSVIPETDFEFGGGLGLRFFF